MRSVDGLGRRSRSVASVVRYIPGEPKSREQVADLVGGGIAGFVVPAALQGLAVVVLSGVLIVAVSEAVLGRRPTAGQVWARARPRVLALLGLSLLTGLLSVVGFAVLIGRAWPCWPCRGGLRRWRW